MNDANNNQLYDATAIRRRFEALGLSRIRAAAAADVSLPTLDKILKGEDVYASNLIAVSNALGLKIEIREASAA